MKKILYITLILLTFSAKSSELKIENQIAEEIINIRMKKMSIINNLSQKIYKQLNSVNFINLRENTLILKKTAIDFNKLFPINSKGGNAKNLVWDNKILFDEYHNNFLNDINAMLININEKNIKSLKKSFNNMSSNCSSCHKKFKNK